MGCIISKALIYGKLSLSIDCKLTGEYDAKVRMHGDP